MSNFTTSQKSKVSENEIKALVKTPIEDKKNKGRFIKGLKDYISDKSGQLIFDQIFSQLPGISLKEFEDQLCFSGYKKKEEEATIVDLDIDLIDLICHDPFIGENLIKCLFRYYSQISEFVKEIFIDWYIEQNVSLSQDGQNQSLDSNVQNLKNNLVIQLNLKLSHFPNSVRKIDQKALLSNNLLLNHGQLINLKFVRVISKSQPSSYLFRRLKKRSCNCQMSP
jgi:hypothetical protein